MEEKKLLLRICPASLSSSTRGGWDATTIFEHKANSTQAPGPKVGAQDEAKQDLVEEHCRGQPSPITMLSKMTQVNHVSKTPALATATTEVSNLRRHSDHRKCQ